MNKMENSFFPRNLTPSFSDQNGDPQTRPSCYSVGELGVLKYPNVGVLSLHTYRHPDSFRHVNDVCKRRDGLVVERRTPEQKVGVRSSLRSPCCVLEQDTFTSQKYW